MGERGGRNWGNLEIGNAAAAEARPSPDQPLRWELDDLRDATSIATGLQEDCSNRI
jgi:hypothetical protein